MHFLHGSGGHYLISLEDRHATNILDGIKSIELRRRRMHIPIGSTIWIYSKVPRGEIVGFATVANRHNLVPSKFWQQFGGKLALSKDEFAAYIAGMERVFGLELDDPRKLSKPISLEELRIDDARFQPPQFYMKLREQSLVVRSAKLRGPRGTEKFGPRKHK